MTREQIILNYIEWKFSNECVMDRFKDRINFYARDTNYSPYLMCVQVSRHYQHNVFVGDMFYGEIINMFPILKRKRHWKNHITEDYISVIISKNYLSMIK